MKNLREDWEVSKPITIKGIKYVKLEEVRKIIRMDYWNAMIKKFADEKEQARKELIDEILKESDKNCKLPVYRASEIINEVLGEKEETNDEN